MHPLSIVTVPANTLNPTPYNPRTWDEKAKRDLAESIRRFGFVDPLIVNGAPERRNIVIGGHFRLVVAKELGLTEVPVVYVQLPDEVKERELNLRLNRNTGTWDLELLKEFDAELLLDVGFDDSELTAIWDEQIALTDDAFDTTKELATIETPETKPGDLIRIGRHHLICGDATDPDVLARLVGETKLDMAYSDPPFNLDYDYQKGLGKSQRYGCNKVSDNRTDEEYGSFLGKTLANALTHLKPDAHIFYYCDQNYIGLIQSMYAAQGVTPKRVCLWIKNNQNVTPQVAFNKCYEPCVYGVRGKPYLTAKATNFTEILNPEIETGNRGIEDILDILDIWLVKRLPTIAYTHPTEKPVTLHERPLKRCTRPGGNVLDLFGGSGSTLIACEQLGRTAFVVEKDPAFCDLIIRRFKATNPTADVHIN